MRGEVAHAAEEHGVRACRVPARRNNRRVHGAVALLQEQALRLVEVPVQELGVLVAARFLFLLGRREHQDAHARRRLGHRPDVQLELLLDGVGVGEHAAGRVIEQREQGDVLVQLETLQQEHAHARDLRLARFGEHRVEAHLDVAHVPQLIQSRINSQPS